MHAREFLHKLLSPVIHQKRLSTLTELTQGLLLNKKLSVTELGRGIQADATERSCIRRADRFIGNKKIHCELSQIYQKQIKFLINSQCHPKIIIDWSHVPNTRFYVLRAALVSTGRALTLYEEVHSKELLGNRKVEKNFLFEFKKHLPSECRPVIISDAGFHNEFFHVVVNLGWDYVGRVRGLKVYWDGKKWVSCKSMMLKATTIPRYMGSFKLCKSANQIETQFFLVKEKSKLNKRYGIHQTKRGGRDRKNHRLSAIEPWLLVSSLKGKNSPNAKQVVKIYKTRMQIEEGFRDLKSPRYGFGLRYAYSRDANRINILLIIAMLATLIAWLIGYVLEKNKLHYQFQVNSLKYKRVLSLVFIGLRAVNRNFYVKVSILFDAIENVSQMENNR